MRLICRLILISFACRCYLSSETPFITRDPRDAIRMEGGKVTFCCEAEGSPAPTYSWYMTTTYGVVPQAPQAHQ